ncbi:MAG: hypothetical protein KGL39_12445 [Patescibacteria group bacterium]|nr:hypothetical protein [Patescibacteria group bacterium]
MARPRQGAENAGGGVENAQVLRKKYIAFTDIETMDTEPSRVGLNPKHFPWIENAVIIAPNDIRSVPGLGSVLHTITGKTISRRYFAYFNGHDYIVAFTSDGAGYTVDVATGTTVNFASAATFSGSSDLTQWEDQRILIGDTTAGYCTYDGALFVKQGNVSPNIVITGGGEGYTSAPTVAINGGTGSGALATATIENGSVTAITLTNAGAGYIFSDILTASFTGGSPTSGGVIGVNILRGGSGYLHEPTITFAAPAGGGTTATAKATVSLGTITGIAISNAGSGYKETPAITITPTGGDTPSITGVLTPVLDTTASANVQIWPFTIMPSTLDVFQGRVWMAAGRELAYTGTAGYDDVDPANAAGSQILQDADVVHAITKLKAANNFLFIVCDQSVKQISTISVSGTTTNFTITTLSSDMGTIWPQTVKSYDRTVVFLNQVGVFGVFGASIVKISGPMSGIVELIDTSMEPIIDVFDFYGLHVLLCLVRYNDPDAGNRSLIMAFYNKRWSVISAGDTITGVVTAHLSGAEKIFSTENGVITQILADSNVDVNVLLRTSLWHNGEPMVSKRLTRLLVGQSSTDPNAVTATIDSENGSYQFGFTAGTTIIWQNDALQTITWQNDALDTIEWVSGGYVSYETALYNQSGIYLGMSISGAFRNYHFNNIVLEYIGGAFMKSGNT